MKSKRLITFVVVASCFFFPLRASCDDRREAFEQIYNFNIITLADEAARVMEEKYPLEDWLSYDFPEYVYYSPLTEMAYKIAVKKHILLTKIHCYCFCDEVGHKSLLYCFFKDGTVKSEFTNHAAT